MVVHCRCTCKHRLFKRNMEDLLLVMPPCIVIKSYTRVKFMLTYSVIILFSIECCFIYHCSYGVGGSGTSIYLDAQCKGDKGQENKRNGMR